MSNNFATCQLQMSESATIKAICFSPSKGHALRDAAKSKSPVKIKRFDYNTQYDNIVINNSTQVQVSDEQPTFKPFKSSESMPIETLKSSCVSKGHIQGPRDAPVSTKKASTSQWP